MSGYNYFQHLIPSSVSHGDDFQKIAAGVVLGSAIYLLAKKSRATLESQGIEKAIVPPSKASIHSIFDFFVESYVTFADTILGKENRKYIPLCGAIFLFVFLANILGLFPGIPAITTTVWVNASIALVVFFLFNYYGIRENGAHYFKHLLGPVWWLAPFFLSIELLSLCLRPLTLNLRLYWNITADHIVLETFTGLTSYVVPIVFYAFGTFVCFMQAFIFSLLTMIYISLATQHAEEH